MPHATDDEDSDEEASSRLHPDDPDNFVKLSTALRLLLSRELEEDDIETADELLREYCTELIEVRAYLFILASTIPDHPAGDTAVWP